VGEEDGGALKAINKLKFKRARGGPIEVLRMSAPVGITSPIAMMVEYDRYYPPRPTLERDHPMTIVIDIARAGLMTRQQIRACGFKRTGRWVIDDLYEAVMVKGRKG